MSDDQITQPSARPLAGLAVLAATTALMALTACADGPEPPGASGEAIEAEPAAPVFAQELGVDLDAMDRSASGIWTEDLSIGTGATAEAGSTVTVDYRAWLADGTLYEERPDEQGFGSAEMVVGEITPSGLNEGLTGMRTGGVRRIVLSPAHGYGLVGRPANVPAGSTLVYEVTLRTVR